MMSLHLNSKYIFSSSHSERVTELEKYIEE